MATAPKKVALSSLNGRTVDILNVIRNNASSLYRESVPVADTVESVVKVGEALRGAPGLQNEFISALMNRIGLVHITSAVFYNYFAPFKKGELEYGETIEEVFVGIARVRDFSAEKAAQREFARSLPDVRSAFHIINWDVQYPVTIQNSELEKAFLSASGVTDMIARIVSGMARAAEYHEWALFKYLLMKGVANGKMTPLAVGDEPKDLSIASRTASVRLAHMSKANNVEGVLTATPVENQVIVIDAATNAALDVNVLADAFNISRANIAGHLIVIDSWTDFPDDEFEELRAATDTIEEFTADELAVLENTKMVVIDREWFQVYDSLTKLTETFVGSGDYWNYWLRKRGVYSTSPFSNAIVFVGDEVSLENPQTLVFEVDGVSASDISKVITFQADFPANVTSAGYQFTQTQAATEAGVAVHKYGALIFPAGVTSAALELTLDGDRYTGGTFNAATAAVGNRVTFTKAGAPTPAPAMAAAASGTSETPAKEAPKSGSK